MTATGLGSSPEMLLLGQRDGKLSLSSIPLLSGENQDPSWCSAPTERCLLRIAVAIAVNQKAGAHPQRRLATIRRNSDNIR